MGKEDEIKEILSRINKYRSEGIEPPAELFQNLQMILGCDVGYKDYLEALHLNELYEDILSSLIDYIRNYINVRAEHQVSIRSISFSDGSVRDAKIHSIIIPGMDLRFVDGSEEPLQIYLN